MERTKAQIEEEEREDLEVSFDMAVTELQETPLATMALPRLRRLVKLLEDAVKLTEEEP